MAPLICCDMVGTMTTLSAGEDDIVRDRDSTEASKIEMRIANEPLAGCRFIIGSLRVESESE